MSSLVDRNEPRRAGRLWALLRGLVRWYVRSIVEDWRGPQRENPGFLRRLWWGFCALLAFPLGGAISLSGIVSLDGGCEADNLQDMALGLGLGVLLLVVLGIPVLAEARGLLAAVMRTR